MCLLLPIKINAFSDMLNKIDFLFWDSIFKFVNDKRPTWIIGNNNSTSGSINCDMARIIPMSFISLDWLITSITIDSDSIKSSTINLLDSIKKLSTNINKRWIYERNINGLNVFLMELIYRWLWWGIWIWTNVNFRVWHGFVWIRNYYNTDVKWFVK